MYINFWLFLLSSVIMIGSLTKVIMSENNGKVVKTIFTISCIVFLITFVIGAYFSRT